MCRYGKEGSQMNQDQANPERATVVDRQENKRKTERSDGADAFIPESAQNSRTSDHLAESEKGGRDDVLPEELGGPFVESGPDEEVGPTRKKERGDHIPPNGTGG
jgi:hypothetical protein